MGALTDEERVSAERADVDRNVVLRRVLAELGVGSVQGDLGHARWLGVLPLQKLRLGGAGLFCPPTLVTQR